MRLRAVEGDSAPDGERLGDIEAGDWAFGQANLPA
jgi:hypothetical protein